jgi:hypothetical protein
MMGHMAFRYRTHARRRAAVAALVGLASVVAFGPSFAVPAIALVAFVYYSHQVAATLFGDLDVPYPSLALVISVNALIVLLVQLLLVTKGAHAL